jgi:hypothetical protein
LGGGTTRFNQYEATMFFGKKKIKEKRFIDYVLEDIPFGLDDTFAMDQAINSSNCLMRTTILGAKKGAIENAAITKAIKSPIFVNTSMCCGAFKY